MKLTSFSGIENIIWDWNGTLLNDVELGIRCINRLLCDRNLPQLSQQKYLNVFGFPVKDYYNRIGFDFAKEDFDVPAHEFVKLYHEDVHNCPLQAGASEILAWITDQGLQQFILSAAEQNSLNNLLGHFDIYKWFLGVYGLNNHYAQSKEEIGRTLITENNIDPTKTCLIGDTVHDFEVAKSLGCHCILLSFGHQNKKKLLETGSLVFRNLSQLQEFIKK